MVELPSFRTGDALTAAAPTRMAIYDRRVHPAAALARGEVAAKVQEEEEVKNGPQNRRCDKTHCHPARPLAAELLQAPWSSACATAGCLHLAVTNQITSRTIQTAMSESPNFSLS